MRKQKQPPLPTEDASAEAPGESEETPVEIPIKVRRVVATRWRVVREALANVNGSFTRLAEGQLLDPLGYSEEAIEAIRAQGVQLEPAE